MNAENYTDAEGVVRCGRCDESIDVCAALLAAPDEERDPVTGEPIDPAVAAAARALMDADRRAAFASIEEESPYDEGCDGGWRNDPPCGVCANCERARWEHHAMERWSEYVAKAMEASR